MVQKRYQDGKRYCKMLLESSRLREVSKHECSSIENNSRSAFAEEECELSTNMNARGTRGKRVVAVATTVARSFQIITFLSSHPMINH